MWERWIEAGTKHQYTLTHIEMEGEGREKYLGDIQDKAKPYRG
jgi:hypothetical protein